ncbi:phosphomannomutase/phosphoglucomutase [Orrella daihaiensis]|uniref:Phosphomannomutase/phosphoglucomutase n=1 Tax=Orrella daihaiensis TaxID=2782176 RepID=A0ABY4AKG6_9BURK|nr:phosphomannomutase/phosphoglucomutase [Orrella daihaiensis]UOD50775.1 phosphomannomutase/phosphoglucomutase [Orrella daihaiensis]
MSSSALPNHVFKAYDIRGEVPADLNPAFALLLGRSLAARAKSANVNKIVIGYDGRFSSPDLAEALGRGIREGGVGTIELGMVPTPLVYFAAHHLGTGSGVAITGSHNPPQYNGFKMMLAGSTLYGDDISSLREDMARPKAVASIPGQAEPIDIKPVYLDRVTSDIKLARPMKIAIDCGNGVAGVIAADLYRALGCEVQELFCDVDARFPNHHPDPAEPHNLQDLIQAVQAQDCELGLAFDGDGDRLGVVTRSGEIIWPDRQMILFARDILSRLPASQILFDVKCSRQLPLAIKQAGGEPLMCRTGHSLVKAKLAETGAPLAGEMSGHIFFKERWFGFDDGLYTGARLLEILSREADPSSVLEGLPTAFSTPELKLEMKEGEPFALIDALKLNAKFSGAEAVSTIDGIRVDFADGFGLARPSNTTPVVVLRFEGETPTALDRIKSQFRDQLQALAPNARLPF